MNQKHQVGARGKDGVKIKLGQKNHESYGLPSIKEFLDSASVEALKLLLKAKSDDLAYIQNVKTVLGEKIAIGLFIRR